MTLPTDAKRRKGIPIATGFLDYFPDAVVAVAELSRIGNDQHNPGSPLHWDRAKSGDESDALMRHFIQRGTEDSDGVRHTTKMAWRAMALLQKELEVANERDKTTGVRRGDSAQPSVHVGTPQPVRSSKPDSSPKQSAVLGRQMAWYENANYWF